MLTTINLTARTVGAFLYVLLCAQGAYILESHVFMLATTSFIHYSLYIFTYYTRWPTGDLIKYGDFMLIVFSFKVLALVQLAALFFATLFALEPYTLPPDAASLALSPKLSPPAVAVSVAVAVVGYYVSVAATSALGVQGTYFGIELGFVKDVDYGFVHRWPYSMFPHPMILGQVVAMAALHLAVLRTSPYWWVLPTHCACYLTHMVQEIYDIHKGEPWYTANKKA